MSFCCLSMIEIRIGLFLKICLNTLNENGFSVGVNELKIFNFGHLGELFCFSYLTGALYLKETR